MATRLFAGDPLLETQIIREFPEILRLTVPNDAATRAIQESGLVDVSICRYSSRGVSDKYLRSGWHSG
jgi:hypothetical protein